MKSFKDKKLLRLHNLKRKCAIVFMFATSCSTQAIFYSFIQIYYVKSFHKTTKPARLFFLEILYICSIPSQSDILANKIQKYAT